MLTESLSVSLTSRFRYSTEDIKKGHCSVSSHLGNMGIEKDNTVMVCLVCLAPSGIY